MLWESSERLQRALACCVVDGPPVVGIDEAEIARFVGQRKLSLTADTYTHVLADGRELDYVEVLR